jgi:hypothetical protein
VIGAANNGKAHRRAVTIRALHEFPRQARRREEHRGALTYAADPVRQAVGIMLDEIDAQRRPHTLPLT